MGNPFFWDCPNPPQLAYFTTDFAFTENPLAHGWICGGTVGLDWTNPAALDNGAIPGVAYGTQAGTGAFDDSIACRTGFSPNQTATGIIYKDPAFSTTSTREVEILLRWAISPHVARGYECNIAYNAAYAEIVRWNGALNDFTRLTTSGPGPSVPQTGDVFKAQIIGNVISVFQNGTLIVTATDTDGAGGGAVWTDGNPGIGFWRGGGAAFPGDYGFTNFTAQGLP